jgi:hypothetical protein
MGSQSLPSSHRLSDDTSYGFKQIPGTVPDVLVDVDEACKVLVPANQSDAPGILWTELAYDDSLWSGGNLGAGYERGNGYQNLINFDVEQEAFNTNGTLLIRIPFSATDPDRIIDLEIELQHDDGFTAYRNGRWVASSNSPAIPTWNSTATVDQTDQGAIDFSSFSLNDEIDRLVDGANILSIHLMNSSLGDDNLLARPQLIATRIDSLTIGGIAYFAEPTPASRNGVQEILPVSEVIISVPSRTFVDPFTVSLSSTISGEKLRYTLDGTEPANTSNDYTGPITIEGSTQLCARVFGVDNSTGRVAMESYIHLTGDIAGISSPLPIMILDTWGKGDPDGSSQKDGFLAIIESNTETGRAEMTDPFQLATRCGLKRRGITSFG